MKDRNKHYSYIIVKFFNFKGTYITNSLYYIWKQKTGIKVSKKKVEKIIKKKKI